MPSKAEYETRLKSYVNEAITKVVYLDGDDGEGNPLYIWDGKPFHNIMWGIEFYTASNRRLSLWWGYDFIADSALGYSLDLSEINWGDEGTEWDVSTINEWKKVIGKKIQSIDMYWHSLTSEMARTETLFSPQDVIITFETNDVYCISLAMYRENDSFYFGLDEVTVFFDIDIAKQYNVPAFRKEDD